MARVGVMADVHANLPALEAALGAIRRLECDVVYSLGDAIAIGPHPAECLDLLLEAPGLVCLMGNHDAWYVRGLPQPRPEWLSEGEIAHQRWVHAQLGPGRRGAVARWPWVVSETFDGVRVTLLHYEPADDPGCFAPCRRDSSATDLDRLFAHYGADVVCYGHTHVTADVQGAARYLNPGALGCHRQATARFLVLDCAAGRCEVERHAVPYDDGPLFAAFEERQVPERAFLYDTFFGGRLASRKASAR